MKKYLIISVLCEKDQEPIMSFITIPIKCSLEDEIIIARKIKEHKQYVTVEEILKAWLAPEQFMEIQPVLETFRKKTPQYDDMYTDFINCPGSFTATQVMNTWIDRVERQTIHAKFSEN